MKKVVKIQCDHCNNQFSVEDIKFSNKSIDKTLKVTYWRCPHCAYPYIVKYMDFQHIELENTYNHMVRSAENKRKHGKILNESRIKKIQSLKVALQQHQKELKDKYEKSVTEQLKTSE